MAVSATRSPAASKSPPPQTAQPAGKPEEAPKKEAPARNTSGSSFEQSAGKPKAASTKDSFSLSAQTAGQTAGASNAAAANNPSTSSSGGAGSTNTSTGKNGVAVIDEFGGGSNPTAHGASVHNVVDNTSQATSTPIKDVQVPAVTAQSNGTLNQEIEVRAAGLLDSSTQALGDVLKNPGQTKVVNQSQGYNPANVIAPLKDRLDRENRIADLQGRPPFSGQLGSALKTDFGFAEGEKVSEKDFYQKLVSHTENQFKTNPRIAEARQRYDAQTQKLEDAGILNVVAAGNEGKTVTDLKKLGVKLDDSFSKNVLANDKAITVGATEQGGKIADFSSPSSAVDVAIQGKGVDAGDGPYLNGTSFSAPQVAATLSDMFAANPDLTNDQARAILREASTDTALTPAQEGHGILDPARARALAEQSAGVQEI